MVRRPERVYRSSTHDSEDDNVESSLVLIPLFRMVDVDWVNSIFRKGIWRRFLKIHTQELVLRPWEFPFSSSLYLITTKDWRQPFLSFLLYWLLRRCNFMYRENTNDVCCGSHHVQTLPRGLEYFRFVFNLFVLSPSFPWNYVLKPLEEQSRDDNYRTSKVKDQRHRELSLRTHSPVHPVTPNRRVRISPVSSLVQYLTVGLPPYP